MLYISLVYSQLLCCAVQTLHSLNAPLYVLSQWGKLTDRRFSSLVAWRRRPHKTSRLRKPELHARALAFPADVIKLRDTFGAQLYSVVVARELNNLENKINLMDATIEFDLDEVRREIAARSSVSL